MLGPLPKASAVTAALVATSLLALVGAAQAGADGVRAQLPRTFLDTDYTAPSGEIIRVQAGDDLQQALDAAQPGDEVLLTPGATYTGNFVLPKKAGDEPIVVRPAAAGRPARG